MGQQPTGVHLGPYGFQIIKIGPVVSTICPGKFGPFILDPRIQLLKLVPVSLKKVSCKSSGNSLCKIDKHLNFDLFCQKGPKVWPLGTHILHTSKAIAVSLKQVSCQSIGNIVDEKHNLNLLWHNLG